MRGLTLWQPYATAIARAATDPRWKLVENRGWAPPAAILGERIAIHAGVKKPRADFGMPPGFELDFATLPLGVVVATARVVGALDRRRGIHIVCQHDESERNRTKLMTLYSSAWWVGPVGWLLEDVVACPVPVPCKGAMGLWVVPPDVEVRITDPRPLFVVKPTGALVHPMDATPPTGGRPC